jgi:hypothetical protein
MHPKEGKQPRQRLQAGAFPHPAIGTRNLSMALISSGSLMAHPAVRATDEG